MTATTFAIDKAQFAGLSGPPVQDQAVVLVKVGRKIPAIGEALQLKSGKAALVGVVVARAKIVFTPIIVRRVLDLTTGGDVGEALGRVVTATEQGASQDKEHLVKLGQLTGYADWRAVFDAAAAQSDKNDTAIELTRQLVAVANLKALA